MKPNLGTLKQQLGFTIIEMMAVIAVIAILSALALPSYQYRVIRQQIEDAVQLADIAKKPVAASWASKQTFPLDNAAAGLPLADKIVNNFVRAVSIQDGAVNVTFGNRASSVLSGKTLTMRPAVVEDAPVVPVTWVCGTAEAPGNMTVKGVNQTSIPDAHLPFSCRMAKH